MKKQNLLVVGDQQWADTIPQWLLDEIREERMINGLIALTKPDFEQVGDAEVAAYLMTASLRAPMLSEYVEIYVYLGARIMKRKEKELTPEMAEKLERGLTTSEEYELKQLRRDIYHARGGDIDTPLLNALRTFKTKLDKEANDPQLRLF